MLRQKALAVKRINNKKNSIYQDDISKFNSYLQLYKEKNDQATRKNRQNSQSLW